jgi:hypothetical protein
MGVQPLLEKNQNCHCGLDLRAARVKKTTVSGIPKLRNYCTVFIVNILYTVEFRLSGRWLSGLAWPFG